MKLFAIRTGIITQESNLVDNLLEAMDNQELKIDNNDVLAIASKIVATVQRRLVKLDSLKPSRAAKRLAQRLDLEPDFVEAVLQESTGRTHHPDTSSCGRNRHTKPQKK